MLVEIESGAGTRQIDLLSLLDAADEEHAHEDAYAWIKAVRHMRVDGTPLRARFTLRGDSLWWFAELYLHKEQAIHTAVRVVRAIEHLVERERPLHLRAVDGGYAGIVAQAATARGIRYDGRTGGASSVNGAGLIRLDARAIRLAAAATLSRFRPGLVPRTPATVAAFVHRAFWRPSAVAPGDAGRPGRADGAAEQYIGSTLRALESRLDGRAVRYVGVGPRSNFRARRWWDPLTGGDGIAVPIERYAPLGALQPSREMFTRRHEIRRQLWSSAELRAHAVIRGVDCWALVREQLAGIALLQFPWSARAMDEAAAALDAMRPEVAVTYAEAGGWGRALALEARRRRIPLAGLQHGFIYRHWLNYRHEPDEIAADAHNAADAGFPLPAKTLLFDAHAAAHLRQAGRFPDHALAVTGSARLDDLVAAVAALTPADLDRVGHETGTDPGRPLIVFAAKEREARGVLPALIDAVREMPEVTLAIKPHPAETAAVYAAVTAGAANVRVLRPDAPLPPLLGAARGVVTVNSTVAIDALALGVPSLVIGLPNNLTPFVDSGAMLGARSGAEIREGLRQLLYNQEFRSKVASERAAGAGGAAAAAAEAILALRQLRS